ncbi:hypothetical protein Tco_1311990 [Tanacetum coccineum]
MGLPTGNGYPRAWNPLSTPYASAPSSPGRHAGFFYNAPTSPSHRNSTLETARAAAVSGERRRAEANFGEQSAVTDESRGVEVVSNREWRSRDDEQSRVEESMW